MNEKATTDPLTELITEFADMAMNAAIKLHRFVPSDAARLASALRAECASGFAAWIKESQANVEAGLSEQLLKLSMTTAALEVAQKAIVKLI